MWSGTRSLGRRTSSSGNRPISGTPEDHKPGYSLCVASSVAEIADSFFRPAVQGLVPYEPGKPVEEVQRELGLARCVKLASNEGPFGPFPAAWRRSRAPSHELNRYPDGGAWRLRNAFAERLRRRVRGGRRRRRRGRADRLPLAGVARSRRRDRLRVALVPSYVIDAVKLGSVPVKVPLRDHRYDLDAMLEAITPRTSLVFVCHPNNPTGTTNTRDGARRVPRPRPGHVLVVIDQAYREYIDDPDYPDAIEEYFKAGRPVAVLRTFSKIYGLAGLRVGYMVAHPAVVTAVNKVKRAFDVSTRPRRRRRWPASTTPDEIARRRRLNAASRDQLGGDSSTRPDSAVRRAGVRQLPLRRDRRRHADRCSRRCWPRV